MKMPAINMPEFKLPDLPKPVALSLAVLVASAVLFGILSQTLGVARDRAEDDVRRLRNDVQQTRKNINQSRDDYDFVIANQAKFEALMASDKLIPHTRRTAIRQMQSLALEFGLTSLNYNFQAAGGLAAEVATSQPKTELYRLNVEGVELTIGAPIDQSVYSFIAAMHDDFPGSMVLSEIELERAPIITDEALNQVSRGQESGLVKGKIKYTWRTAQQNKQDEKK